MGIVIRPSGLTKTHLKEARIGEDYWEVDFANYEGPLEARNKTVVYLHNLESMKDKGIGILYGGPNGPGKTTLAMIAMKYLIRARWSVYTTSLGQLVETIQRSWDSENKDEHLSVERAKQCDFLFIDDLGKEHRGGSGFVQTVFDNLIRHRIQHRLPTFITTNLNKSQIESTYGQSVISLLEGKMQVITVNGADYRRTKLKQEIKELT